MQRNANFFRMLFILITIVATTSYEVTVTSRDALLTALIFGTLKGFLMAFLVFAFEAQVKKLSLRAFNTAVIGIIVGTAMGWAISNAMKTLFSLLTLNAASEVFDFCALTAYLGSLYFSIVACYSMGEAWWGSLSFIKQSPAQQNRSKEILVDISALEDTRFIDLARTGVLDGKLALPTFIMKELYKGIESTDESIKSRSKKCLENLKRLESLPHLELVQKEFSHLDGDDVSKNLLKAAKHSQAALITSDTNIKQTESDGIQVICIETIANAIKPTAQRGETLTIKIQRPGKEPKQGVGYLEDGTMVVVNGGGDFLGETIKTQVLSQKYSTSGKIIFCNALQEEDSSPGNSHTPYYASQPQRQETFAQSSSRYKKDSSYDTWNRH